MKSIAIEIIKTGINNIMMNLIETSTFLTISIALNFFLLSVLLIANFRGILGQFLDVKKKTWVLLFLIFLMGFYVRFTVPHYHKMYIDEHWNMAVGKNILQKGRAELCHYESYDKLSCTNYVKPVGVPFIYSISFLIFGVNNFVAIDTTAFLGSLSIILMFLFGYLLFKNENVGLFSALFLALFPLHIYWSASAETNVISIFFILLTLLCFLIYFRNNTITCGVLAIASLTYALQARIENVLLLPLLVFMFLLFDEKWKNRIRTKKFWIPFLVCGVFFISWVLQALISYEFLSSNYASSYELEENPKDINFGFGYLQFQYFKKNIREYGSKIISGFYFPLVINILIVIGLLSFWRNKKAFIFLILFFLAFFTLFMFYDGIRDRFLLPSFLGLLFLGGCGGESILEKITKIKYGHIASILLVTLILISFYPLVKDTYLDRDEKKILETQILALAEKELPDDCVVIAPMPEIFTATTGIKAIRSDIVTQNPEIVEKLMNKTSCVLFFEDMTCFYKSELRVDMPKYRKISLERFDKECEFMGDNYKLTPYLKYESYDGDLTFRFHKISPKKKE